VLFDEASSLHVRGDVVAVLEVRFELPAGRRTLPTVVGREQANEAEGAGGEAPRPYGMRQESGDRQRAHQVEKWKRGHEVPRQVVGPGHGEKVRRDDEHEQGRCAQGTFARTERAQHVGRCHDRQQHGVETVHIVERPIVDEVSNRVER
jgi:hypothetical protein